mgnify:FL=1|jgi:hypothetical protein
MDDERKPNISPAAPLDGTYRYEIIQTTGLGQDVTYYVDIWFIYGADPNDYDDAVNLKRGDKVLRNTNGEISIVSSSKPGLRLVVNNG